MKPSFRISSFSAASALFLLFLTTCGTKPDGTPYGVDPSKTNAGRHKEALDSAQRLRKATAPAQAAVADSAKAGQPLASQPQ
jgi:hypothetical protein